MTLGSRLIQNLMSAVFLARVCYMARNRREIKHGELSRLCDFLY